MAASDAVSLAIFELADRIRSGRLSSADLTQAYLERIDRYDRHLKAFITVADDAAKHASRTADAALRQGRSCGPLHGIPYAVKDLFQTRGIVTTGGSRVLADWVPDTDAAAVERLTRGGAVLIGKTNLHEFAYGATGENPHFGTACNPYDPSRLAGGSSSGSAVAVAARLTTAALGTDTGGSVRVPAALCGIVGLKPTQGRISTRGVIPYCWSLDHVGILARTSLDAALILGTIAEYDQQDPASADVPTEDYAETLGQGVRGLRLGVPRQFYFEHADSEILDAVDRALVHCERLGARIIEVKLPSMEHVRTVSLVIQMPEALSYHSRYLSDKADLYANDFRSGLAAGQFLLAEHYVRAKRMVEQYRRETDLVFGKADLVVTPTCPITAPALNDVLITSTGLEEPVGNALTRYTTFFNLTGHPAVTTPSGLHSNGLPMGVQVIGPHFQEATVLRVTHALEEAGLFSVPHPRLDRYCAGPKHDR
ncbi:MAG: amidase [Gammaproteobacteria bacterium]|nr:amidase [Gammaproteobacteria bacterium]NIR82027.1 amidase [Gammaproteobacteria bacterium]NIR89255.1 amidase [Gammaproteobacteria bacterium]NIU03137.1 amidase [Gammaproteobacteria bacterium]NIV50653.1 Asp-tRNA(Asn)/Glu-tRNA(Gln) amidotransferase GatCAB subunit A [Gammaproteobacteria bacterium]